MIHDLHRVLIELSKTINMNYQFIERAFKEFVKTEVDNQTKDIKEELSQLKAELQLLKDKPTTIINRYYSEEDIK
jgi:hypothetical protein